MKPIKEYQEAVNYLKGYYDYEIDKEYAKKINTIQEIIDNYKKLEEALDNACMELEVAEVMLHKYTKGIKFSKEQWKEYLLNETN